MMDFLTDIINALKSNQLLAGGLTLGIVGGIIAMLRNAPKKLLVLLKDAVTISIEIRDEAVFAAFAEWLAAQRYGRKCRRMAVTLDSEAQPNNKRTAPHPEPVFSPSRGHHIIRHGRRFFWLERRKDDTGDGELAKALAREVMMLRMIGRSPESARAILRAAVEYARLRKEGKAVVHVNDGWGRWEESGTSEGRPLHSVILREGLLEELVEDAETFLTSREYYESKGVPYRRVYLLHGPPRTGKSSAITAIAAHFNAPMYILSLSAPRMTDDHLLSMTRNTLPGAFILLEDVDAAFVKREGADGSSSVTFSGLLNTIDGVGAQQGRLIFLTTNHRERLERALLERADVDREVSYCDADQLRRMFLHFFPEEPELASRFQASHAGRQVSPCSVQRHLMLYRGNAYYAARRAITSASAHINEHGNGVAV